MGCTSWIISSFLIKRDYIHVITICVFPANDAIRWYRISYGVWCPQHCATLCYAESLTGRSIYSFHAGSTGNNITCVRCRMIVTEIIHLTFRCSGHSTACFSTYNISVILRLPTGERNPFATFQMCSRSQYTKFHDGIVFTRGQFWPSGIVVGYVCLSVCAVSTCMSAR